MKRRDFLNTLGLSAGAIGFVGTFLKSLPAAAAELLDMTGKNPKQKGALATAKGLNYVHDLEEALKSGKMKKTDRKVGDKVFKPSDQTCATCSFYKEPKDGMGKCTLLPGVLVKGKGSCNSWVPGPNAKPAS